MGGACAPAAGVAERTAALIPRNEMGKIERERLHKLGMPHLMRSGTWCLPPRSTYAMGPLQELTTERVFLVLCAFVSRSAPSAAWSASLVRPEEFIEVFVDTPVDVCMQRDPKGL
jgi:hypothetical protein